MSLLQRHKNSFPEIDQLYAYQEEAINNLVAGNNTLSIVPTGGGKSLIFQLVALELSGITLVISPLVALMNEQVEYLIDNGINALALNSTYSFKEQRDILRTLPQKELKILYLSPERLYNTFFRQALLSSGIDISMVVVDEAHCISQWGNDFRPDYAHIMRFVNSIREQGHQPVLFTLTATVGIKERKDVIEEFGIDNNSVFIHNGVIRDELKLSFLQVSEDKYKSEKLIEFIQEHKCKKVLIYLYSRQKCEDYAKEFEDKGFTTAYFHSGGNFTDTNKKEVFKRFKEGEIDMLFATTAFGMGINIPDIDAIIHLQLPNSVEEYYQHAGRGARDKSKCSVCNCLLLYSETNIKRRRSRIAGEKYDEAKINDSFELLGFEDQSGEIVGKDFSEYRGTSKFNLPLIRYHLENRGVITWVGEVNGTPLTIRFENEDELWLKYIKGIDGTDDFEYASMESGISIPEMIEFIYEQELNGNIEHLPAMKKTIFFQVHENSLSQETTSLIMKNIDEATEYKLAQFEKFVGLIQAKDAKEFIAEVLGV